MPVLSRRALYEMIWTDPVRTVAQTMGLSDVGLKKICNKAQIPVPERGYWTKLRAGHPVKQVQLPPRGPGMPAKVQFGQSNNGYTAGDLETELGEPAPDPPEFEDTIDDVRARVTALIGKVRLDRGLASPHPLVRGLLAADETRSLKRSDAPWRSQSVEPLFGSAFERRRLRILSSLFTALQSFGAQPWIGDDEARDVGVVVGAQRVGFRFDHPSARPDQAGRWATRRGWADVLQLTIDGEGAQRWSDSEEHALEVHLTDIVVQLIMAGELRYRAAAQAAHERALTRRGELAQEFARRRIQAVRRERDARIAAEQGRRSELLGMAADFRAAQDIRALVDHLVKGRGADGAISHWSAWALAVADRLDPSGRLVADEQGHVRVAELDWSALVASDELEHCAQ